MPTGPRDYRIAQFRIITDQLLDRGTSLMDAIERARAPGGLPVLAVVDAFEQTSDAVLSIIRLDMALAGRAREMSASLTARIIIAICGKLDAAAALLPDAAKPPRHTDSAILCERARRLVPLPTKRAATILPFVRPPR